MTNNKRNHYSDITRATAIRLYSESELTEEDLHEDLGNMAFYDVDAVLDILGY